MIVMFHCYIVAHRLTILNVDEAVKEAIEAHQNGEVLPLEPEPVADESAAPATPGISPTNIPLQKSDMGGKIMLWC